MPEFGPMRMIDILPEHVRQWITKMEVKGASAWTIQYCKYSILNSIFSTATLEDRVITFHPSRGVRTPTVPSTPRQIITPEQFDAIYQALPDADTRLLVETAVESGLRWGELTELRVHDIALATRILTVSRKVIEVNRKFQPEGKRFTLKEYPKDKEYRRLKLSAQLVQKISTHVESQRLGLDDLLFSRRPVQLPARQIRVALDPATLGLTEPNEAGRRYRHGTLSAYTAGECRCDHCRGAFAVYRAGRRASTRAQSLAAHIQDNDTRVTGSAEASGYRPVRPPGSDSIRACTTSARRMLRGSLPGARTSRLSRSDLATHRS
jgi:integrase